MMLIDKIRKEIGSRFIGRNTNWQQYASPASFIQRTPEMFRKHRVCVYVTLCGQLKLFTASKKLV